MKLIPKLRRGMAGLRASFVACALIFSTLLMAGCTARGCSSAVSRSDRAPASFDGKAVYDSAFAQLRDNHYTLTDPAARAAFVANWQHKHDNDDALSTEKGTDMAVCEMMWSLGQRFDYYLPPEQTKGEHERADATIGGIGLALKEDGLLKAIKALGPKPTDEQVEPLRKLTDERPLVAGDTPDEDTPAGKAHIAKGDRIVAVDDASVNDKTIEDVVKTIRGPVGTTVVLTIAHKDAGGKVVASKVVLTRAKITLHVVKTDYQGRIAHIRLTNFESQFGASEMEQALETANRNNAAGIILDLRGNPGGRLDQVIEIAQMFVDQGVILQVLNRVGDHMVMTTISVTHDRLIQTAQPDDGSSPEVNEGRRSPLVIPPTTPMLILVDEGSASASEILSGALQARGRARVIGQPSVGKGVGQLVAKLPYERSMHVTNFEFFPGGVKMDWVGIVPDIEVKLPTNVDDDFFNDPSNDTQLNAAKLELIDTAIGSPTPPRSQTEMDARRAELEKKHRDDFQKEVLERQEVLKKAAAAANAAKNPADPVKSKSSRDGGDADSSPPAKPVSSP